MIKLNVQKPESKYPLTVVAALKSEAAKKFKPSTIYKMVSEETAEFLKLKSTKFSLTVCKTEANFVLNKQDHHADFPHDASIEFKMNMLLDAISYAVTGKPSEADETDPPVFMGVDLAKPEAVVISAHDEIESEMSGIKTVPKLIDAVDFYDQVQGSDSGSKYVFVARKGTHHLALRIKHEKVSVRMEPYSTLVAKEATVLGLNEHGDLYASVHFQAEGPLALKRYLILMESVLDTWDVANINEEKIRELGH